MTPAHACLLVLTLLFQPPGAPPPPTPPLPPGAEATAEAKALAGSLVKEGVRAYRAGRYLAALSRFEQAYTVFPSPGLLYWLGQAYRQVGRPVDATASFERFLRSAGTVPAALRRRTEQALTSMRRKVARIEVFTNVVAAQVLVDGRSHGLTPLPGPVLVAAGVHEVIVHKPGLSTYQRRVPTPGGSIVEVHVELSPLPARAAPPRGRAPAAPRAPVPAQN